MVWREGGEGVGVRVVTVNCGSRLEDVSVMGSLCEGVVVAKWSKQEQFLCRFTHAKAEILSNIRLKRQRV
jgi:hypothetical protein